MRVAIFVAIAAIGLGVVGSSAVSAAPAYGTSMQAAAANLDLRQHAYVVRRPHYRPYYRPSTYQFRNCFQTCAHRVYFLPPTATPTKFVTAAAGFALSCEFWLEFQ